MSEGTDLLVPQDQLGVQKYSESEFDNVAKVGDYLPRLQLFGGNSDAVKTGLIPIAMYGFVIDSTNIHNLGNNIDIAVLKWRPKAMRIADGAILSYYDTKNKEFAKVQAESDVKDSGCMFGPEFLVWIPTEGKFATFFMSSKTNRKIARNVMPLLGKAMTLKIKLIEAGKYKWHAPVVLPCTTPLATMWDGAELAKQIEKFDNPAESTVEKADANTSGREV